MVRRSEVSGAPRALRPSEVSVPHEEMQALQEAGPPLPFPSCPHPVLHGTGGGGSARGLAE
eukprot:12927224-Prorocentrum_lima.AAC.1